MASTNKKQQAQTLKEQGMSTAEIGKQLGVSERQARRYLSTASPAKADTWETNDGYTLNDRVDNRLRILSERGQSSKYECYRYIAEQTGMNLSIPEEKAEVERLFTNAVRRLQYKGESFDIVPIHMLGMKNPVDAINSFYEFVDELWWMIDTKLESFIENYYTDDKLDNTKYNIRYALASALRMESNKYPKSNEALMANYERQNRVAQRMQMWQDGKHTNRKENAALVDLTIEEGVEAPFEALEEMSQQELAALVQEQAEERILRDTGISPNDVPY